MTSSSWPGPLIPGELAWSTLWTEFLSEASRFDGRRLIDLFGDTDPVRTPDANSINWSKPDRLLIGEFIRRHHPRLAHEVALAGVPGPHLNRLALASIPSDLANLAGLVARSHGIGLRTAIASLGRIDSRQYKGVHAAFLMVLLRISDYLQMQSERAPNQLLQVKQLCSPFSAREWRTHSSVLDIRHTHNDPEAIYIEAAPADVKTFTRLKKLIDGLQSELDISWAVLGETYGRFGELAMLGIAIRRVRSNIDIETSFAKTVSYLPVQARFESAGTDLLKLLVGPLYENAPQVGIRELVQNSIDACLERKDYEDSHSHLNSARVASEDDVTVRLIRTSERGGYLEVIDNGIGMTPFVILNYFLKAGASFRRSNVWRRQHERSPGESNVLRSGRFGVGALAAFLLGDEISVTTRHIGEEPGKGISFTATLDTEDIQLNFCERSIGTTVTVRIDNEDVWHKLTNPTYWLFTKELYQWDYYCGSALKVGRYFGAQSAIQKLAQRWHLPPSGSALSLPRHRIAAPGFDDLHWSYTSGEPALVCNDILVNRWGYGGAGDREVEIGKGLFLKNPAISVFDRNGLFPVNLQRNGLAVPVLPFKDQLIESQCEDFIAWVLVNSPVQPFLDSSTLRFPPVRYDQTRPLFGFVEKGSLLIDSWTMSQIRASRVVFVPTGTRISVPFLKGELRVPLDLKRAGADVRKAWFRCAMGWNLRDKTMPFDRLGHIGARIIVTKAFYETLKTPGIVAQFLWSQIRVDISNDRWTVLSIGNCTDSSIGFERLVELPSTEDLEGLTEYFPEPPPAEQEQPEREMAAPFPLERTWKRLLGKTFIPFCLKKRRQTFSKAYKELHRMIAFYQDAASKDPTGESLFRSDNDE